MTTDYKELLLLKSDGAMEFLAAKGVDAKYNYVQGIISVTGEKNKFATIMPSADFVILYHPTEFVPTMIIECTDAIGICVPDLEAIVKTYNNSTNPWACIIDYDNDERVQIILLPNNMLTYMR